MTDRNPQLALHLHKDEDKVNPKHAGEDYGIFEKHDGWYGYLDFPACVIRTRRLREIPALVELSAKIRAKRPNVKGRLIFEIMIEGLEIDSFYELNGILNRQHEQADGAYLRVHDFLPFWSEVHTAELRYRFAKEVVKAMGVPEVLMSELLEVSDNPKVWKSHATQMWEAGREGVILKRWKAGYSFGKRNADILKIKEELTLDMVVTGIKRGKPDGKYADTTGTLTVQEKSGKEHDVSGMTDAMRESTWNEPESIIGQVVEIKAMKRLPDGSLREPRFKAIRYDKTPDQVD